MKTYKRLDLSDTELRELIYIVKRNIESGAIVSETLKEKIENAKEIKVSSKKSVSAMNATDAKKKRSAKKIKMALEYIERENKKMNYATIAKYAEISPITVKKYVTSIIDNKATTSKEFYYLSI